MSIIIPYEEQLYDSGGAFIDPSGKIIYTHGEHTRFASNYCLGREFDYLSQLKYNTAFSPYAFEDYKIEHNYQGRQEDIDNFGSSQLTKEQLELFKLYWEGADVPFVHDPSDFLVMLLHYDKVETVMRKCITTTDLQPHVRFFNYYLMDWSVMKMNAIRYNYKTNEFEYEHIDDWNNSKEEKEAEEEISDIKSKVLIKDRPLFFK